MLRKKLHDQNSLWDIRFPVFVLIMYVYRDLKNLPVLVLLDPNYTQICRWFFLVQINILALTSMNKKKYFNNYVVGVCIVSSADCGPQMLTWTRLGLAHFNVFYLSLYS